ncbi:prostaglandin G/H synthase 2-like [Lampetra fluviatilis]
MTDRRRRSPTSRLLAPWLLLALCAVLCGAAAATEVGETANPCCSFPCRNKGVCTEYEHGRYDCDCTYTGYHGKNCTIPELRTAIVRMLKPSPDTVHWILTNFPAVWDVVNSISILRDAIMRYVLVSRSDLIDSPPTYNSVYGYKSWEAYSNLSYFTRILPPVPRDCPTPMGIAGKPQLPGAKLVAERLLLRRQFKANPHGSNLMFAFFAQHFTHQFFNTDPVRGPAFTRALGHGVDLNHIYGGTLERQHQLRLFKEGKLKFQLIDGEAYPPLVRDAPVHMVYPEHVPASLRFAVGHEVYGLLPGLLVYATVWLREHNRVCDVLRAQHPRWDDERLFQTARLILTGETIKIVIEEYVQHLSGYNFHLKFDPTLLFGVNFQYSNRMSLEFNHLYHWHPLMPDSLHIDGRNYSYNEFLFNPGLLADKKLMPLVRNFMRQQAGTVSGGRNVNKNLLHVATSIIEHGRTLRLQSLNQYRHRFNMRPFTSFLELAGDEEMAAEMEELYGDVDAVEFYVGLLAEKSRQGSMFGESMVEIGAPFSLKGLMSNPVCSPLYWKPSTFGGDVGFDIVNTASLRKLVCQNVVGPCPRISFAVPEAEAGHLCGEGVHCEL